MASVAVGRVQSALESSAATSVGYSPSARCATTSAPWSGLPADAGPRAAHRPDARLTPAERELHATRNPALIPAGAVGSLKTETAVTLELPPSVGIPLPHPHQKLSPSLWSHSGPSHLSPPFGGSPDFWCDALSPGNIVNPAIGERVTRRMSSPRTGKAPSLRRRAAGRSSTAADPGSRIRGRSAGAGLGRVSWSRSQGPHPDPR